MDWKELLQTPLAALLALGSVILAIPGAEFAYGLLSSTIGPLFTALSLSGSIVLPELGYGALGTKLLLVGAFAFIGISLARATRRAYNWTKE